MSFHDLATVFMRKTPAEFAHRAAISALKMGFGPRRDEEDDPALVVRLQRSRMTLRNPIGLAAGFDKNAEVGRQMLNFGFGFVECGTVTPRPQAGNAKPRLFRLNEDRAVINRMGFNNDGLHAFTERLGRMTGGGIVGANVGANKDSEDWVADYVSGLEAVWAYASYVTMNISSPNTPGLRGLQEKNALEDLLGRTGEVASKLAAGAGRRPLYLKLAPDLDAKEIAAVCGAVETAPYLHGLIISNTTIARPETLRSPHAGEGGGLSGLPLMDKSTDVLRAFSKALGGKFDLIGAGGISSGRDAWRKLQAGADAVQLYSALVFEGPGLVKRIKRELLSIMRAEGLTNLSELRQG